MDRIVYCPSEEQLDEASILAKEWSLPIQIGESSRTKDLVFDREKTGVIVVPVNNYFLPFPAVIKPYEPMSIDYFNDFIECSNLEFSISTQNNIVLQTIPMRKITHDKHHVSLPLFLDSEGHYKVTASLDGEQVAWLEFAVSNGNESDIGSYA